MKLKRYIQQSFLVLAVMGLTCTPMHGMSSNLCSKITTGIKNIAFSATTLIVNNIVNNYRSVGVVTAAAGLVYTGPWTATAMAMPIASYGFYKLMSFTHEKIRNVVGYDIPDALIVFGALIAFGITDNDTDYIEFLREHGVDWVWGLKQLLDKKVLDPNLKVGSIPLLHRAIHNNGAVHTIDVLKLLLQYDANINAVNNAGQTALQRAEQYGTAINQRDPGDWDPEVRNRKMCINIMSAYLRTATEYQSALDNQIVESFLRNRNFEERQNVLEIALAKDHRATLVRLNKLNPQLYSWEYMLALAAEEDLYKPVATLFANLGIERLNHKDIQNIFTEAQINNKENFYRAMLNYGLEMRKMQLNKIAVTTGGDKGKTLPDVIADKIAEFRGNRDENNN